MQKGSNIQGCRLFVRLPASPRQASQSRRQKNSSCRRIKTPKFYRSKRIREQYSKRKGFQKRRTSVRSWTFALEHPQTPHKPRKDEKCNSLHLCSKICSFKKNALKDKLKGILTGDNTYLESKTLKSTSAITKK